MSDGGGSSAGGSGSSAGAGGAAASSAVAGTSAEATTGAQAAESTGGETNEATETTEANEAVVPDGETEKTEKAPEEKKEIKKHKYADRLNKAYPDRKFASDDDFDKGMDEHLDYLEGYESKGKIANQNLIALFEAEPTVGEVVRDMINGATFREALARHISQEDLTAVEGDPDYDGWNKNKSAREAAAASRKATEEEYGKNLEFSQAAVKEFAAENKMSDEQAETYLGKFDAMLAEINSGKITKETLMAIKKAFDFDNAVAAAAETGEIKGKNQKIVAQKETPEAKGDGLPKLSGSSETKAPIKAKPDYMDGLLTKINDKKVL